MARETTHIEYVPCETFAKRILLESCHVRGVHGVFDAASRHARVSIALSPQRNAQCLPYRNANQQSAKITITCRIPPAPLVEAHPVGGTPATAQMSARSSVDARRPGAGLKQQARPAPRSAASAAREGRAAWPRRARRRRRAQSTRAGRPVAALCSPAVAAPPRTCRWSAG